MASSCELIAIKLFARESALFALTYIPGAVALSKQPKTLDTLDILELAKQLKTAAHRMQVRLPQTQPRTGANSFRLKFLRKNRRGRGGVPS
jgi:hypothetical protein